MIVSEPHQVPRPTRPNTYGLRPTNVDRLIVGAMVALGILALGVLAFGVAERWDIWRWVTFGPFQIGAILAVLVSSLTYVANRRSQARLDAALARLDDAMAESEASRRSERPAGSSEASWPAASDVRTVGGSSSIPAQNR